MENGRPKRCDNPLCVFHIQPLEWNKKELRPILDHVNGNPKDNSPNNLQYLCPNCDSQQLRTRGGANKGRLNIEGPNSYMMRNRDGTREQYVYSEGGIVFGGSADVSVVSAPVPLTDRKRAKGPD